MDIVETLRDFPAVDPYTVVIALDPGAYCFVPDAVRNEAADEIERLRIALAQINRLARTPSNGQHAYTHFMRDFDAIRRIIQSTVQ